MKEVTIMEELEKTKLLELLKDAHFYLHQRVLPIEDLHKNTSFQKWDMTVDEILGSD
jgi:hypothetical protein